ncbi:hypothetical protein LAZ67_17000128 [Cordylochernes scorpioides]|uniref:Mos1 transposase HTH domain-containing protein n=1 Tax=Cordylochernes scorpioides TaxID=51811 RepID=A0ABY6LF98_9ARAC|nr:hypothetical protein LAZ67_17000128 [Cordylochernes scorpioides]
MLEEVYSDHALSKSQCYRWFKKFQNGDFELDNEPHGKPPQKFEDAELQALLDEDSTQMQEKLAKQFQGTSRVLVFTPTFISRRILGVLWFISLNLPVESFKLDNQGVVISNNNKLPTGKVRATIATTEIGFAPPLNDLGSSCESQHDATKTLSLGIAASTTCKNDNLNLNLQPRRPRIENLKVEKLLHPSISGSDVAGSICNTNANEAARAYKLPNLELTKYDEVRRIKETKLYTQKTKLGCIIPEKLGEDSGVPISIHCNEKSDEILKRS